jgi:pyruvate dehydrogenase E2 component (dihydrolipoamide acetyltransferase)
MTEFLMPSLGADMEAGMLREWRVKPGDKVRRGDIIADVETQKGIIEIEIFEEGIIDKLLINENDKVPVGTVMALLTTEHEEKLSRPQSIPSATGKVKEVSTEPPQKNKIIERHTHRITPLARKMAADNNIDLMQLIGTGELGAITKEDVEKAIAGRSSIRKETSIEATESIRQAVAAAMSKSNREIPHYYLSDAIDMSKALAWLSEKNVKTTPDKRILPVALLIKASALSLKEVPELNGFWDNGVKLKNDINIGFVVSLHKGGIVVPAINNTATKSVDEIMDLLNDLIPRARQLRLKSSELTNSTITITSLGDGGSEQVFGIIYPPQIAIIGFGGIKEEPFAENGMLDVRPVIQVTLAGDHRATDGLTGSRFLGILKTKLQTPEKL